MKQIVVIIIFCTLSISGKCQMAEMLETMLQQIAAFEGYLKTAEKGYQITEDGWHTIKDIKNGEFNLHAVFFSSLKAVNPKVAQMAEVAEIISLQVSIAEQITKQLSSLKQSNWMQAAELDYISQVYTMIGKSSSENLNALLDVLTDDKLEMSDGERIKRIDAIANNMRAQSSLINGFSDHANLLLLQQDHESEMNGTIKKLYGLP